MLHNSAILPLDESLRVSVYQIQIFRSVITALARSKLLELLASDITTQNENNFDNFSYV